MEGREGKVKEHPLLQKHIYESMVRKPKQECLSDYRKRERRALGLQPRDAWPFLSEAGRTGWVSTPGARLVWFTALITPVYSGRTHCLIASMCRFTAPLMTKQAVGTRTVNLE
jgi:hypothetical protein